MKKEPKPPRMGVTHCGKHRNCEVLWLNDRATHLGPSQVHWLAAMLAMSQNRTLGLLPGRLR